MSRLTAALLVVLVAGSAAMVHADEHQDVKAWIKYLKGEWTSELDGGSELVKGTAVWRTAAKGNAGIGRFTSGETTGVEIGGWQSGRRVAQVNGFNSDGDYWQLEYKTISAKGGEGSIRGTHDGEAYTGKIVVKVTDKDHWQWTIEGKDSQGEDFSLSSKLTRKGE